MIVEGKHSDLYENSLNCYFNPFIFFRPNSMPCGYGSKSLKLILFQYFYFFLSKNYLLAAETEILGLHTDSTFPKQKK